MKSNQDENFLTAFLYRSPLIDIDSIMAKKAFLLRIDEKILAAIQRMADEELRSLNGQIEYLLRQVVVKRGVKRVDPQVEDTPDEKP